VQARRERRDRTAGGVVAGIVDELAVVRDMDAIQKIIPVAGLQNMLAAIARRAVAEEEGEAAEARRVLGTGRNRSL
jgi:hypothetical protein